MSRTDRPFVVGVSGAPGAGKTTLSLALSRAWGAPVLHYDKYQPITRLPMAEVQAWFARGGDPNEIDHSQIVGDLRDATRPGAGPLLIFETPFGRLHRDSGTYIDYLIWIDAPLDLALSRALLAISQGSRGVPPRNFLDWLMQYLQNYPAVRPMYARQRAQVMAGADLTLDGEQDLAAWLAAVERAQPGRGRNSASS
jgi:uridine kinase